MNLAVDVRLSTITLVRLNVMSLTVRILPGGVVPRKLDPCGFPALSNHLRLPELTVQVNVTRSPGQAELLTGSRSRDTVFRS